MRASAGSLFRVPLGSFDDGEGIPRVALVPRGGTPLPQLDLPERALFVLGAEREGLPDDVLAAASVSATIPQVGRGRVPQRGDRRRDRALRMEEKTGMNAVEWVAAL